jgi:hypothetical protein
MAFKPLATVLDRTAVSTYNFIENLAISDIL